ncbi:MAG: hypothetical protein ACW99Q_06150 [Candidatus Kariarchaeaceae archaeon]
MAEFLDKKQAESTTHHTASPSLLKSGVIPLAVFYVSDAGPAVLYRDFASLPDFAMDNDEIFAHLQQMALGYISALGMGHAYEEGVFDLPVSGTKNYRTILMCFKLFNPKAGDKRLMIGYYQFAFLFPVALARLLPATSAFENGAINIIKSMLKTSDNLVPDVIDGVKERILGYILSFVRKQQVEKVIDDIL